jgi:hypothetical protein
MSATELTETGRTIWRLPGDHQGGRCPSARFRRTIMIIRTGGDA